MITARAPAARKRVLVIDDSPIALALMQRALEDAGFSVATARTLDAFEAKRVELSPDLILVDVQMPEAFGDDVAALLRGGRGVDVPILLVSSIDETVLARRAAAAEADGYISKRAGVEEIVRRVCEYFGQPGFA